MTSSSGDLREELLETIHHVSLVIRTHLEASALRVHGLTWIGFRVLADLRSSGEVQIGSLAKKLGASAGTLTGVVKTLERRGLTQRRSHRSDGRLVLIRLTAEGEAIADDLTASYHAEARFIADCVDDQQARALITLINRITAHLTTSSTSRCAQLHANTTLPPRPSGRRPGKSQPDGSSTSEEQADVKE